jgi:hypothetical protein
MAKDIFHDLVRNALQKEGWTITDDPLKLPFGNRKFYVDLAAEKLITAEKQNRYIAVEVKSFTGRSAMADRVLYLAMPNEIFSELVNDQVVSVLSDEMEVRFIVYSPTSQTIVKWIG